MRQIVYSCLIWLILGAVSVLPNETVAQNKLKQEVEKRIKKRDMPQPALDYLSEHWLPSSRKVRYYYETDGKNTSYEAKLTRDKRRFSIEFDQIGTLEDIEELIYFEIIPASARNNIDSMLTKTYQKYQVQRVQRQFLPDTTQRERIILWEALIADETKNFEIEINTQDRSRVQSYEMLFNSEGHLVQRRTIVRRSLDNFLY